MSAGDRFFQIVIQSHGDPRAPASGVLGLKACSSLVIYFGTCPDHSLVTLLPAPTALLFPHQAGQQVPAVLRPHAVLITPVGITHLWAFYMGVGV